jgi:peptidoglycan/xylan/chitin deacetylase (PgdA/CDA1 family)
MYHHVSDSTPAATSVTPETFARHLEFIDESGLKVVSLMELLARVTDGRPHDGMVAITFDDGYTSVAEQALPLLNERGWPAAIFISVAQIGSGGTMTLKALQAAHEQGHAILNHGYQHFHMVRNPVKATVDEIEKAQIFLEKHFVSPRYLAWPYGESSPALEQALAEKGYYAFGQHTGPVHAAMNWQAIPRIAVNQRFSSWQPLYTKLTALPLPVQVLSPVSGVSKESRPVLTLVLPPQWQKPLNCFVGGQTMAPRLKSLADGLQVRLQTDFSLAPGRHRYTCTASAGQGRFHWFSWQWMIRDGEQWYKEP